MSSSLTAQHRRFLAQIKNTISEWCSSAFASKQCMSSLIINVLKPFLPLECRINVRNLKELSGATEQLVKYQLENVCRATLVDIEWMPEGKKVTGDFVFYAQTPTFERPETMSTTEKPEKIPISELVKHWRDLYRTRYGNEFGLVQHVISSWKEVEVRMDNRVRYMPIKTGQSFQKKAVWLELDKIFPKEVRKLDSKHTLLWLLSRLNLWTLFHLKLPKNLGPPPSTTPPVLKRMKFVGLTQAHVDAFNRECKISDLVNNKKKVKLGKKDQQKIIAFLQTLKLSSKSVVATAVTVPKTILQSPRLSDKFDKVVTPLTSAQTLTSAINERASVLNKKGPKVAVKCCRNEKGREMISGGRFSESMMKEFRRLRGYDYVPPVDPAEERSSSTTTHDSEKTTVSVHVYNDIILDEDCDNLLITNDQCWDDCYRRWCRSNIPFGVAGINPKAIPSLEFEFFDTVEHSDDITHDSNDDDSCENEDNSSNSDDDKQNDVPSDDDGRNHGRDHGRDSIGIPHASPNFPSSTELLFIPQNTSNAPVVLSTTSTTTINPMTTTMTASSPTSDVIMADEASLCASINQAFDAHNSDCENLRQFDHSNRDICCEMTQTATGLSADDHLLTNMDVCFPSTSIFDHCPPSPLQLTVSSS